MYKEAKKGKIKQKKANTKNALRNRASKGNESGDLRPALPRPSASILHFLLCLTVRASVRLSPKKRKTIQNDRAVMPDVPSFTTG